MCIAICQPVTGEKTCQRPPPTPMVSLLCCLRDQMPACQSPGNLPQRVHLAKTKGSPSCLFPFLFTTHNVAYLSPDAARGCQTIQYHNCHWPNRFICSFAVPYKCYLSGTMNNTDISPVCLHLQKDPWKIITFKAPLKVSPDRSKQKMSPPD